MRGWPAYCCPLVYLHISLEQKMELCDLEIQVPPFQREWMRFILTTRIWHSPTMISLCWFSWPNLLLNIYKFISFTSLLKAAQRYIIQDDYSLKKISSVQHKYWKKKSAWHLAPFTAAGFTLPKSNVFIQWTEVIKEEQIENHIILISTWDLSRVRGESGGEQSVDSFNK